MLIRVIAEMWVPKSERVLISQSIEATPMYHYTCTLYVHTYVHMYVCYCYARMRGVWHQYSAYQLAHMRVVTKLWGCLRTGFYGMLLYIRTKFHADMYMYLAYQV